ncbi:hypothetical protein [Sinorhizobium meliloti]|uniref:hypothetical protein n=1 Tax=Rhizobium meliloti TaxID=382 RepID=UPI001F1FC0E9|nr:hypothetical protein [Sinorhizobium meliloti]
MSKTADEPLIAFVRALARRQARIDIELEAQRHSDPDSLQPEARDMPNVGKIRIGDGPDDVVVLFDPGAPPLHVDIFTELDEEDGIVQISFAAITQDGDGTKKADIVARLRMKKELGWALCRALNKLDAR